MASPNVSGLCGPGVGRIWLGACDATVSPAAKSSLVATHCLAAACLAACAGVLCWRVDRQHPVFAVLYQEVLILLPLSVASAVSLLALLNGYLVVWVALTSALCAVAVQVHQMSWLAVTCLRYHFLVRLTPVEVEQLDMGRLRRRSLMSVWVGCLMLFAASTAFWTAALLWIGFPRVRFVDTAPAVQNTVRFLALLLYNVPDYLSIGIYLRMLLAFRAKVHPAAPPLQEIQSQGDSIGSISQAQPEEDGGSGSDMGSVLRILRTHAATSLAEVAATVPTLLLADPAASIVYFAHVNAAAAFWLPTLVIGLNFNRKNGVVLRDLAKELCGIWV